ncbi:DUF433 domain-containing protein [Adhaeretor mobilis]|uniref:DUF433 domain-containing protein n=1 Tax=Adhaeretor mobilis TaxID=1930276 RepID=A0A517MT93_9BACT|nr:DUF433 domain-containing protein [Adhaeretor mobilis]QDS98098.1 hypothetical protein HG15A2_13700 [Adhaeretor mobilis]
MSTPTIDQTNADFPPELPIEAARPPLRVMAGGKVVIGNSRVRLASVIREYRQGSTAEEILEAYEALQLPDIYGTISYYLRHRDSVDQYLERLHQEEEATRAEWEASHPKTPTREELLKRLEEKRQADAAAGK